MWGCACGDVHVGMCMWDVHVGICMWGCACGDVHVGMCMWATCYCPQQSTGQSQVAIYHVAISQNQQGGCYNIIISRYSNHLIKDWVGLNVSYNVIQSPSE